MTESDTVAGATTTTVPPIITAEPSSDKNTLNDLPLPNSEPLDIPSADPTMSPPSTTAPLLRTESAAALGPATDAPVAHPPPSSSSSPPGLTLNISLMLTTGARHPYKIDEKYLSSRKVSALNSEGEFDPRALSGYQLKELIWTDWRREDWEERPVSPSSIRLILMGRMIEDKGVLRDFPFNMEQTNVVHMTVKPADLIEDEAEPSTKGKSGVLRQRDAGGEESGSGCRCVVQ